jgi:hypothetical protein
VVFQDAYLSAQHLLDDAVRSIHAAEIVISGCAETDRAWVFFYNTRSYLETGSISDALVGNGPVIVPKDERGAFIGSMFQPPDDQLDA